AGRVQRVAAPAVQRAIAEGRPPRIPFAAVVAQRLQPAGALRRVEPAARQQQAGGADAVLEAVARQHARAEAEAGQGLHPRLAAAQLLHARVVRQDVLAVGVAAPLQLTRIVVEPGARGLVVVDQPDLATPPLGRTRPPWPRRRRGPRPCAPAGAGRTPPARCARPPRPPPSPSRNRRRESPRRTSIRTPAHIRPRSSPPWPPPTRPPAARR